MKYVLLFLILPSLGYSQTLSEKETIKTADSLFNEHKFREAKVHYETYLKYWPNNQYVKDRLVEIAYITKRPSFSYFEEFIDSLIRSDFKKDFQYFLDHSEDTTLKFKVDTNLDTTLLGTLSVFPLPIQFSLHRLNLQGDEKEEYYLDRGMVLVENGGCKGYVFDNDLNRKKLLDEFYYDEKWDGNYELNFKHLSSPDTYDIIVYTGQRVSVYAVEGLDFFKLQDDSIDQIFRENPVSLAWPPIPYTENPDTLNDEENVRTIAVVSYKDIDSDGILEIIVNTSVDRIDFRDEIYPKETSYKDYNVIQNLETKEEIYYWNPFKMWYTKKE